MGENYYEVGDLYAEEDGHLYNLTQNRRQVTVSEANPGDILVEDDGTFWLRLDNANTRESWYAATQIKPLDAIERLEAQRSKASV